MRIVKSMLLLAIIFTTACSSSSNESIIKELAWKKINPKTTTFLKMQNFKITSEKIQDINNEKVYSYDVQFESAYNTDSDAYKQLRKAVGNSLDCWDNQNSNDCKEKIDNAMAASNKNSTRKMKISIVKRGQSWEEIPQ